jgi:hypothetical protein
VFGFEEQVVGDKRDKAVNSGSGAWLVTADTAATVGTSSLVVASSVFEKPFEAEFTLETTWAASNLPALNCWSRVC